MKNKYGIKMVRISGIIPEEYNRKLKELEKEIGCSKSNLLRQALKKYLEESEKK